MPASLSIEDLLAAAQERQLWPECESSADSSPPVPGATSCCPVASPLQGAVRSLCEQVELTLGARTVVVGQQLEKLRQLLGAPEPTGDAKAAWAALDELEDQLEALLRD